MSEEQIIVSQAVVDIHRQKIKYIINYVIRKWGLGSDPISGIALKAFLAGVNGMSDEDVEEIFEVVKKVVEK